MRMRLTEAFFSTLKTETFPSEQVLATEAEERREFEDPLTWKTLSNDYETCRRGGFI
jgi:hypothetical protein